MKKLHGIRVVAYGQKRHKRNRQRAWKKAHSYMWNIFGFLTGKGVAPNPITKREFPKRPERYLKQGKSVSFLAKMRRRRSYVG